MKETTSNECKSTTSEIILSKEGMYYEKTLRNILKGTFQFEEPFHPVISADRHYYFDEITIKQQEKHISGHEKKNKNKKQSVKETKEEKEDDYESKDKEQQKGFIKIYTKPGNYQEIKQFEIEGIGNIEYCFKCQVPFIKINEKKTTFPKERAMKEKKKSYSVTQDNFTISIFMSNNELDGLYKAKNDTDLSQLKDYLIYSNTDRLEMKKENILLLQIKNHDKIKELMKQMKRNIEVLSQIDEHFNEIYIRNYL